MPAHRERLDAWLADFVAGPNDELRLGDVALGDLPCLFWPAQPGDVERPDPIVDPPYPTFVLTADADPATPMVNALRVFERLDDAYLVVLQDGPHVIFDWGYTCVDDLIAGYLGEGTPAGHTDHHLRRRHHRSVRTAARRLLRRDRSARRRPPRCDVVDRDRVVQQRRVHVVARRRTARVRMRLRRDGPLRADRHRHRHTRSTRASSATATPSRARSSPTTRRARC